MKTRWGVWGSGGIARRRTIPEGIARAANAELVAVYDVNHAANEEIARQYGSDHRGLTSGARCPALQKKASSDAPSGPGRLEEFFHVAYRHRISRCNVCYPNLSHDVYWDSCSPWQTRS
ncbi:MAG: hypothetical protein HY706_22470 [Candidatus Hydrogenedentes bacterium]|nr:hypothetical protein [Candidatus Hydrogenedentota bacterium]